MGTGTSVSFKDKKLTSEDLAELVGTLGSAYEEYKAAIVSNGVDGDTLFSLVGDEGSLAEVLNDLGITKKLHQKVIISKLGRLFQPIGTPNTPADISLSPPTVQPVAQRLTQCFKLEEKLQVSPRALMGRMFLIQGIKLDPLDIKPAVAKIVAILERRSDCDGVNAFHCFLSYRCSADADVAEKLYWMLKSQGFFPFLDKECLVPGMSWKDGFLSGLQRSLLFLPLISRAALAPVRDFSIDHSGDMVLLEHATAFQVMDATENPSFICPIHVGQRVGSDLHNFVDFDLSLYADKIEAAVCKRFIDGTLIFPPGVGPGYAHSVVYMFYRDAYIKWNMSMDKVMQGSRLIKDGWPGYPFDRVEATLVFPPGVGPSYAHNAAYMFCGDSYCKWNLVNDRLISGARKIKDGWPGYPFDRVDATLVYPPGVGQSYSHNMAYMFCNDSYCRWNLTDDTLSQGARKIKDGWKGYPFDRVDAVIIYPPGDGPSYTHNMAYMFCGDAYCRWNLTDDTLSQGARKIKDGWTGYPFGCS